MITDRDVFVAVIAASVVLFLFLGI